MVGGLYSGSQRFRLEYGQIERVYVSEYHNSILALGREIGKRNQLVRIKFEIGLTWPLWVVILASKNLADVTQLWDYSYSFFTQWAQQN